MRLYRKGQGNVETPLKVLEKYLKNVQMKKILNIECRISNVEVKKGKKPKAKVKCECICF